MTGFWDDNENFSFQDFILGISATTVWEPTVAVGLTILVVAIANSTIAGKNVEVTIITL